MNNGPILKYMPQDFAVREVLPLALSSQEAARYRYVVLKKCGFTTREVIPLVAGFFDVPPTDVTYAGLKDEDAVTEQYLAVTYADGKSERVLPWSFNDADPARWFTLSPHGYGPMPLRIGALDGNTFIITVRNIEIGLAERLQGARGVGGAASFPVLNYYDVQRFGVPGGPKRSHFVGEYILAGRWSDAIWELAALNAAESRAAGEWKGDPEVFFRELDPRIVGFYLSSFASMQWNRALSIAIAAELADGYRDAYVEGLQFRLVCDPARLQELAADVPWLPYTRFGWDHGHITEGTSKRATVVQTSIATGQLEVDGFHPGRMSWQLQFFLPSGCYATAALRQFLSLAEPADMHIALSDSYPRAVAV